MTVHTVALRPDLLPTGQRVSVSLDSIISQARARGSLRHGEEVARADIDEYGNITLVIGEDVSSR